MGITAPYSLGELEWILWRDDMATLEMGIRIDREKGIAFFGVDEVNERIATGARIIEVRPGGAIMTQLGEDGENVTLTLGGCQFQVIIEDS